MKTKHHHWRLLLAGMGSIAWLSGCTTAEVREPQSKFVRDVKPVLEYFCIECHTDRESAKYGGFSLETGHSAMTTGRHAPVIIPRNPDASLFYKVLRFGHEHPLAMPPAPDKISDEQFEAVRSWIAEGAAWPKGPEGHLSLPH
jgi:hypothetical protein